MCCGTCGGMLMFSYGSLAGVAYGVLKAEEFGSEELDMLDWWCASEYICGGGEYGAPPSPLWTASSLRAGESG